MSEDNTTLKVDEIERIKWFISRIDLYHKINLESNEIAKKIFESTGTKTLSNLRTRKKEVFSILGIILTGMFGFNTFTTIPEWVFYLVLSILSGVGVIAYIVYNLIEGLIDESFSFLNVITTDGRIVISESQSFVSSNFADLEFLDINVVKNYGVFSVLIGIANTVKMAEQLKEYRTEKSKWFVDMFNDEFKQIEKMKEVVPDLLKKFDEHGEYPELGYELIEKYLMKKKK